MMKFATLFQQDDVSAILPIRSPCAGYYTNIRVQHYNATQGEDPWIFWMGVNYDKELLNAFPSVAGDFSVNPDLAKNAAYLHFLIPEISADGPFPKVVTKHFGNKRVRLDHDDELKIMTHVNADASENHFWLVQADFIPDKGALWRFEFFEPTFSVDPDWTELPITIPFSVENAQIEIVVSGDATQVASEGTFQLRIHDPDEIPIVAEDTFSGTLIGDVRKELDALAHAFANKNVIAVVDISIVSGGKNKFQKTFNFPRLGAGQYLTGALKEKDGSFPNMDVTIRITGIVANKHYSNDANFLSGSEILNLNELEAGRGFGT